MKLPRNIISLVTKYNVLLLYVVLHLKNVIFQVEAQNFGTKSHKFTHNLSTVAKGYNSKNYGLWWDSQQVSVEHPGSLAAAERCSVVPGLLEDRKWSTHPHTLFLFLFLFLLQLVTVTNFTSRLHVSFSPLPMATRQHTRRGTLPEKVRMLRTANRGKK